MAINLKATETHELRPRITVLGVGGAGGNAVNNMIEARLDGVDFVVANTDAQALAQSRATRRIQLGASTTEGLGAGAQPDVGRAGAEESLPEIMEQLAGSHMVFITAGMGGGTGTGAAPVIARAVREAGILTVGVVTKPFAFEGGKRMQAAERGIADLQQYVHTLIVIPNQNLFRVANDRTTFAQAFAMADEVLHAGVRGVTDLIVMPGLINLDFADIKSVISEMGKAMMGTGEAEGEDRAQKAADMAISNPLLDDVTMKGARGVLINITGGPDLMLFEVEQAANRIRAEVDPDANIIFGNTILEDMEGRIRVSVVATGIDAELSRMPIPEKVVTHNRFKAGAVKEASRPFTLAHQSQPQPQAPAAAATNPVAEQIDQLAREMGVGGGQAYMAGGAQAPEVAAPAPAAPEPMSAPASAKYPATESYRPLEQQPLARPLQEREQKRGWGFFGRRKSPSDMRAEPMAEAPRPTPMPQPRATAQTMNRPAPVEQQQPQQQSPADDLFSDHKRDEQFEIPAFLRRQAN
ncbi:MAG: cell division protein FtsZ [Alphaproteobacteria bacterium 64-11]|nr:cell division protein FtsZ [Alphaproteobacteria bacterium]OJU10500.1 MAG: cell division protein FtsZ [Alphaproteobacteria bacterium 64-11]